MSFLKYSLMVLSSAAAVAMCTPAQAQEESAPAAGGGPSLTWSGWFRFRVQHEKQPGGYQSDASKAASTATKPVFDTRDDWFERIAARIGVMARVNDDLAVGIRLATSHGPTGGNQNLGDTSGVPTTTPSSSGSSFNSKKDIYLDLAYLDYRLTDGLNIQAGKAPNMYWSAGKGNLMYSGGESLDGINLNWQGKGDAVKPWVFAAYDVIANRNENTPGGVTNAKEGNDIYITSVQGGATWTSNQMWITAGLGDYMWNNLGGASLDVNTDAPTKSSGNTTTKVGGVNVYAYDFNVVTAGLEVGYEMGFAPVTLATEYIMNTGNKINAGTGATFSTTADTKNAWQANIKVGDAKKTGWWAGGGYRDIGSDAMVGELRRTGQPVSGGTDMSGWDVTVGKTFGKGLSGSIDYENGTRNLSGNDTATMRGYGYENMNFNIVAEF